MNPQRDGTITKLALERLMEDKDNQWILGGPIITSGMGSLSASIATNIDIWQRNTDQRRKKRTSDNTSNVTRKDT